MNWDVYNDRGVHEAKTHYAETAAAVVAFLGAGAIVTPAGRADQVVWREGAEEFSAAESYDNAALTMLDRKRLNETAPEIKTGPPEDGCDRCPCGAKYWHTTWHGTTFTSICVSCGEEFKR